jgi:hypothetical protein
MKGVKTESLSGMDFTSLTAPLICKGAIGVQQYEQKLKDNAKNPEVLGDLIFEQRAALLFLSNGFKVTLRDGPDLKIELDNEVVYAEVKHFREKEQDRIDDKAMSETRDLLVPIGDTAPLEGSAVWEQIADVAIRKAHQYTVNAPNILIIESSSDSTSLTLLSVAHEYSDRARQANDPRLRRLNALMLVNCSLVNFGRSGPYNTEFCPLAYVDTPMSKRLISALFDIRLV